MNWRLSRLAAVIAVSYIVEGFFLWQGLHIVTHATTNVSTWLGWLALGVGTFKALLWTFVTVHLLRHRKSVAQAIAAKPGR